MFRWKSWHIWKYCTRKTINYNGKKDTTATQFDKIFTITQNEHKIPLQQFYNKLHDQGNRCLRFIFFYIDLKLSVESKFVKKYHL